MPEWKYVALTKAGKRRSGVITATDQSMATLSLRELGMYAVSLRVSRKYAWLQKQIYFGRKVSSEDFSGFCRQLATLIRAGVTILDSVRIMSVQTTAKPLKLALEQVVRGLEEGRQFSQCTMEFPDIFPKLFVNMVRAGEVSGTLDNVLDRSARYYERDHYTREKVKSALVYPAIVGVVSVLVTIFMLVKIVPTFVGIFAQNNVSLPAPTLIVMAISHFMMGFWWLLLLIVVAVIVADRLLMRVHAYERLKDLVKLRMPIFGPMAQKALVARMARTMSSLFASAVPVLESLRIVSEVVSNSLVSEMLQEAAVSLQGGHSLAAPIAERKLFPPLVVHMIMIGEQTGNLDFMLEKVADFYEAETEASTERLKAAIEPLMIVVLALIVGTIVTAVILPSFQLISVLH